MKKIWLMATLAFIGASGTAFAAGSHAGGHGDGHGSHDAAMAIGMPGDASDVSRVVEIRMLEPKTGGMAFEPSAIKVMEGETLRFIVENEGALEHEIVFDTKERTAEHKALMAKFPEMEHDDPNAVRLAPGEIGEIVWTFANTGTFQFACLIPGHMDAGMHGALTVK